MARRPLIMMLLVAIAISAARADTLLVFEVNLKMAGSTEDQLSTVNLWSRADRIARVEGNRRMIGHLNSGAAFMVSDERETCFAFPPQEDGGILAATEVDVRETGESRPFGSWQAKRYELTVATDDDPIEIAVWVSEDLPADVGGERAFAERLLTADTAWLMTLFDLGGYPVRQEISMGPIKTTSELVSVDEKSAPAGIYDIPSDYTGCD